MKLWGLFCTVLFVLCLSSGLRATDIDLNTWTQLGPGANGDWTVSTSGNSVLQFIDGGQTIFASPEYFINSIFSGRFAVNGFADDDYVGFVFGLRSTEDFYLFDWKQAEEGTALAGYTLAHVTGGLASIPFYDHQSSVMGYEVLAYDAGTGWADLRDYNIKIIYQSDRIQIFISEYLGLGDEMSESTLVLDVSGSFSTGRFGFYNYSQPLTSYADFTVEGVAVPEPALAILAFAFLGGVGLLRRKRA